MRGTYSNTYKMSYEVCSCLVGGLKMRRGGFKKVRFMTMLLDELNILEGRVLGTDFCCYVVGCMCRGVGGEA